MEDHKIFDSEMRFCNILWENEPISSTELVHLCAEQLEWKKSTTYTVIKRLSEREIIRSENAIVTSLIKKDQAEYAETRAFVDRLFGGSLPSFLSAFTGGKGLSSQEAAELRKLIDEFEEREK